MISEYSFKDTYYGSLKGELRKGFHLLSLHDDGFHLLLLHDDGFDLLSWWWYQVNRQHCVRGVLKKFVAQTWRRRDTRVIQCMGILQVNIRKNSFQIHLLFLHAILEAAYLQTLKTWNYRMSQTMLSRVKVGTCASSIIKYIKTYI